MKTSLSALTLDEMDRLAMKRMSIARRLDVRRRIAALPRLTTLQKQMQEQIAQAKGRYQLHEKLLLLWYSRHSTALESKGQRWWLADPLARWRTWWRSLGAIMLLSQACFAAASSWVAYRCAADRLCNLETRDCPDLYTLVAGASYTGGYGCRRDLAAQLTATAVRCFSAVEIGLGLGTGLVVFNPFRLSMLRASAPHSAPSTPHRKTWAYGTSGGMLGMALLLLDVVLLLSPDVRALPQLVRARLPLPNFLAAAVLATSSAPAAAPTERGSDAWWSAAPPNDETWWSGFCNTHQWCRENPIVRTVTGYQRLVALEPQWWPIQAVIDHTIEYLLPDQGAKLRALPTVGDILLEGELMQTFLSEFLSSAKLLGLVLSILKSHRVRRGARALRRDRAVRKIVQSLRRLVVHRRVGHLQRKHAWWTLLTDALAVQSPTGQRHVADAGGPMPSPPRRLAESPNASFAADFMPSPVGDSPRSNNVAASSLPSTDERGRSSSRAQLTTRQLVDDLAARGREISPRHAIGSLQRNLFSAPAQLDALRQRPNSMAASTSGEWSRMGIGSGSGEWRRVPSMSGSGSGEWRLEAAEATRMSEEALRGSSGSWRLE